jgi:hypothetical protein
MNYVPRQIDATSRPSYRRVVQTSVVSGVNYKATTSDYVDAFYANLHKWRSETYYLSSAKELQEHPSFRAIVELGEAAIALILDDLKRRPSLLSLALGAITGENAVPDADKGNVRAMANAWISWGRGNGF